MKSGDIIDVYKTRFKRLSKYYHRLLEDFKPADIHHFRLEVKKLRAFIHLVHFSMPGKQRKVPEALKLFYEVTGNIRNLQLHQKRIVDLCNDLMLDKPSFYLHFLADEQRAMCKQARQMAKHLSLKNIEAKLIEEAPRKLSHENIDEFVQRNFARLNELATLTFYADEAIHQVRKIMKGWIYNAKYLGPFELPAIFSGLNGLKSINAITSMLGDYHDLCISLSLLGSTYVTQNANTEEMNVLGELKVQLQLRNDVMRIQIAELMKQLKQKKQERIERRN